MRLKRKEITKRFFDVFSSRRSAFPKVYGRFLFALVCVVVMLFPTVTHADLIGNITAQALNGFSKVLNAFANILSSPEKENDTEPLMFPNVEMDEGKNIEIPVIIEREKIVEVEASPRVIERVVQGGNEVNASFVLNQIAILRNNLEAQIAAINPVVNNIVNNVQGSGGEQVIVQEGKNFQPQIDALQKQIALLGDIDKLVDVEIEGDGVKFGGDVQLPAGLLDGGATLTDLSVTGSGTSTTLTGAIQTTLIDVTSTSATSTFANGIQLASGCFRLADGTCAGAGGGSGDVNTGTAGALAYFAAAGTTLSPTTLLHWDNTNSKFGIASSAPWARLSLDAFTNDASTPAFAVGTSSSGTATSTAFVIDGNGRVGIGTSTPSADLSVAGESYFSHGLTVENGTITVGGLTINPANGSWTLQQTSAIQLLSSNAVVLRSGSGDIVSVGNGTDTSGLAFQNSANASDTELRRIGAGALRLIGANNDQYGQFDVGTLTVASSTINFGDGTATSTLTSSSGNLGIGTTTPYLGLSSATGIAGQHFNADDANSTSTFLGGALFATQKGTVDINDKLIVRQRGGTEGTDELQLYHDGSKGYIVSKSGDVNVTLASASDYLSVGRINFSGWWSASQSASGGVSFGSGHGIQWGSGVTNVQGQTISGDTGVYRSSAGILKATHGDSTALGGFLASDLTATSTLTVGGGTISFGDNSATTTLSSSGGLLGIATTTPSHELSVGGIAIAHSLRATDSAATSTFDGGLTVGKTNLVVSPTGNVGVNTENPEGLFTISGSGSNRIYAEDAAGVFRMNWEGGTWAVIHNFSSGHDVFWGETSDTGNYYFRGKNFGITQGTLTVADLGTGANYYVCASAAGLLSESSSACSGSSIDYKENVGKLTLELEDILKLNPVEFDWKQDYRPDQPRQLGFIAQEVAEVSPLLINYKDDKLHGVQYAEMSALLTKGVQEISTILDIKKDSEGNYDALRIKRLEDELASTTELFTSINIESIEERITRLEEERITFSNSNIITDITDWIGEKVTASLGSFDNLFSAKFTVGSTEAPAGITLFDEVTGDPYCLKVSNGLTVTKPGHCDEVFGSIDVELPISGSESPIIEIIGNENVELTIGQRYNDLGARVEDDIDNNLGYKVFVNGISTNEVQIDTNEAGSYEIRYEATDSHDNTSSAKRNVEVIGSEENEETNEDADIEEENIDQELTETENEESEEETTQESNTEENGSEIEDDTPAPPEIEVEESDSSSEEETTREPIEEIEEEVEEDTNDQTETEEGEESIDEELEKAEE